MDKMPTARMTQRCAGLAAALGVPVAGSAVERTSVWIVLEHRGPWPAKAVRDGLLPALVKQRLIQWEAEIEGARVQLVRRSGRRDAPPRLWLALSELGRPRLRCWSLSTEDDVLTLDVPALVERMRSGESIEDGAAVSDPMVLVCTNGRRDVCCSVRGIPVVQALAREPGLDVWQTTHLGGHRFAATLLVLPAGLCYGFVEVADVTALAEAIRRDEVFRLDRFRGRTALSRPEQAAEVEWRERHGIRRVDALAAASSEVVGEHVKVELRDRMGSRYEIRLEHRTLEGVAPSKCGALPEPVRVWSPI